MKIKSSCGKSWEFIKGQTGYGITQLIIKQDGQAVTATLQNTIDNDNISFHSEDMLSFLIKHIEPSQREGIAKDYISENPHFIGDVVNSWASMETTKDKTYREKASTDEVLISQLTRDLSKKKKEAYKDRLCKWAEKARYLPKGFIARIFEEKK